MRVHLHWTIFLPVLTTQVCLRLREIVDKTSSSEDVPNLQCRTRWYVTAPLQGSIVTCDVSCDCDVVCDVVCDSGVTCDGFMLGGVM